MKPEYKEGPEAANNFKTLATALFQVPKDGRKKTKKRQPKKATARKTSGKHKG